MMHNHLYAGQNRLHTLSLTRFLLWEGFLCCSWYTALNIFSDFPNKLCAHRNIGLEKFSQKFYMIVQPSLSLQHYKIGWETNFGKIWWFIDSVTNILDELCVVRKLSIMSSEIASQKSTESEQCLFHLVGVHYAPLPFIPHKFTSVWVQHCHHEPISWCLTLQNSAGANMNLIILLTIWLLRKQSFPEDCFTIPKWAATTQKIIPWAMSFFKPVWVLQSSPEFF